MAYPGSSPVDVAKPHHDFLEHDKHTEEPSVGKKGHRASREVFVRLELGYATHRICRVMQDGKCKAWDDVKLRSYNGKLPGPVIEASAGDTLNITLDNQLPHEPPPPPHEHASTEPHGFNTTNLHFHGLHVSPAGNADNVNLSIGPHQMFEYEVKIPHDHPAGTYWYHAHKHGSATLQLASGMAGALIIRGDIDKVPAIEDAKERIILFQQIPYVLTDDPTKPGHKAHMVEDYALFKPGIWQSLGRRFTLNGVVEPTFELCPGEVERWRFILAGIREGLRLRLVKREEGKEIALPQYVIAHDGITTGRIDKVMETEMHPGYRVDAMVRASEEDGTPLKPGTYWLVDEAAPAATAAHTLARVVVKGRPVRMALPKAQELAPLAPFKPIQDSEITGHQAAVFHIDTTVTPPRFLINGKVIDPHNPRKLTVGAVEEWTVSSQSFNHPFHIHVNPFQVKTEDGKILWKDTLMVQAGKTYKLRTRYRRYIGTTMMHCHILEHGDLGMAEVIELLPSVPHGHPPHH